jgi:hypothetical protein
LANLNIYLVAQYVARPKDPKQTARPGYMSDPDNIEWDERMYITRGLRDSDAKNNVILNLTEEKIVKNSFNSGKNFEEVFKYFCDTYPEYINDSINKLNEAIEPK